MKLTTLKREQLRCWDSIPQLQLWTNILAIYIRIQLLAFHYLREPKPGINQMTFGTMVVELWTRDRKAM